jgi:MarR family transcriptional regulator, transcriptional regulator for hemolysin
MQKKSADRAKPVQQPVSTLFHEISLMVARLFNRQVKEMGLTRTQWQVLYLLYMQGEQSQTNIADTLMMAKPPLGKVVERLEDGGWIKRRDDGKDRRAKLVSLTPKIQPMLNSLESLVDDIGGIATRGMSKQEAVQFYKLLKMAHANLMAEN